jgi:hypothetical protein
MDAMTPEQAAHARHLARRDAELGLGLLPEYERGTGSPRGAGIMLDLGRRLADIDAAEARGTAQRQAETERAAWLQRERRRDLAGQLGADATPAPGGHQDEQRITAVMEEMRARGLGRI